MSDDDLSTSIMARHRGAKLGFVEPLMLDRTAGERVFSLPHGICVKWLTLGPCCL
jgi:hypothetical protein